jgi:hypothetical protein
MGRVASYVLLAFVCDSCLSAFGCANESNGPAGPSVVATEIWTVDVGGGQGHGDFRFIKKSDGVVTALGEWTFGTVFCPFSSGPGAVTDSTIAFSADGIANDNSIQSDFTLNVNGKAGGGSARGAYAIVFAQGLQVPGPLTWTATRTSGTGITP